MVATLFGADFFFLLQFPRAYSTFLRFEFAPSKHLNRFEGRIYPRWYNTTKKFLAVIITLGTFIAAIVSSVSFSLLVTSSSTSTHISSTNRSS